MNEKLWMQKAIFIGRVSTWVWAKMQALPINNRKIRFRPALFQLYFILCIFFQEKHTFSELCSDHHSSHLQHWLTYLVTFKRDILGEDISYHQPHSFPGYTYVSLKVSRDGHGLCPLQSSHECTSYKFETVLNKQSKSDYLHTLRTLRVITWLRLMVDKSKQNKASKKKDKSKQKER